MRVVPPRFCDGDQVVAVLLHNGFQLLLFIAHATCIGVNTLELGCQSKVLLEHYHSLITFGQKAASFYFFFKRFLWSQRQKQTGKQHQ